MPQAAIGRAVGAGGGRAVGAGEGAFGEGAWGDGGVFLFMLERWLTPPANLRQASGLEGVFERPVCLGEERANTEPRACQGFVRRVRPEWR